MDGYVGTTHVVAGRVMLRRLVLASILVVIPLLSLSVSAAEVVWQDDANQHWVVPETYASPTRWVVLGPHLVDMVEALGVQGRIVGVQDDHPLPGAWQKSLSGYPVVGQAGRVNEERLRLARPDLIIYWPTGMSPQQLARLKRQGIALLAIEPRTLQAIPQRMRWLGWLSGQGSKADTYALKLEQTLSAERVRYAHGARLKGFFQIWQTPLYSLAPDHLVSQAMQVCGVDSIVPVTATAAPVLSAEFVLRAQPDVILVGRDQAPRARQYWSRFPSLKAAQQQAILAVDETALTRPGLSLLRAIPTLCDQLQPWRHRVSMSSY